MSSTEVTTINHAPSYSMMLRDFLALFARNTIGVEMISKPFKADIIIRKLFIEVSYRVVFHFNIPPTHVLYHKIYVLSRDNYLY